MTELPAALKNVTGDLNKFVDQVYNGAGSIVDALKINKALIYNNTKHAVNF